METVPTLGLKFKSARANTQDIGPVVTNASFRFRLFNFCATSSAFIYDIWLIPVRIRMNNTFISKTFKRKRFLHFR